MAEKLSMSERMDFDQLEARVEKGLGDFVEVGGAILTIRDRRLYRETHATFEAYCLERWTLTKTHANRLIAAYEVVVGMAPNGCQSPANERVARPLAKLEPEERDAVWAEVTAGGHEPTAAEVAQAVQDYVEARSEPLRERVGREEADALKRSAREERREKVAAVRAAVEKARRLARRLDADEAESLDTWLQPALDYLADL